MYIKILGQKLIMAPNVHFDKNQPITKLYSHKWRAKAKHDSVEKADFTICSLNQLLSFLAMSTDKT